MTKKSWVAPASGSRCHAILRACSLLACLLLVGSAANAGQPEAADGSETSAPRLRIELHASRGSSQQRIVVTGLSEQEVAAVEKSNWDTGAWARLLAVYVAPDHRPPASDLPAMLGSYRIEGERFVFEPGFPLRPGLNYWAIFDPGALPGARLSSTPRQKIRELLTLGPPADSAPTQVEAVFPSQAALPENLLKFYLHFSAPMSRGEAYRRIRLLKQSGREVEDPFLELAEELWDPGGTRLTLLLDPGRIKRGLKPRQDVGPALEEGQSYTLAVDPGWLDAAGKPLKKAFRKTFTVTAADAIQPDPARWTLAVPPAGSTEPLEVVFEQPLDRAMLPRVLAVTDRTGHRVPGKIAIDRAETRWRFSPAEAWQPGAYRLVSGTTLEDRSGNSIARPFEVDVFGPVEREPAAETVVVPFEVESEIGDRTWEEPRNTRKGT